MGGFFTSFQATFSLREMSPFTCLLNPRILNRYYLIGTAANPALVFPGLFYSQIAGMIPWIKHIE
jgi:hypothetical protein